jgi:hypothetical protein
MYIIYLYIFLRMNISMFIYLYMYINIYIYTYLYTFSYILGNYPVKKPIEDDDNEEEGNYISIYLYLKHKYASI